MNKEHFSSILAPYMTGFIKEKRSLGFDYHTEELILIRFDQYCTTHVLDTVTVTREFLDEWCLRTDTEGLSNQNKRLSAVRQLMLYMAALGIRVYLPKAAVRPQTVLPHIFTEAELQGFFYEADTYKPSNNRSGYRRLAKEYSVLFRMLYCCGLRNSEGCGIATDQVDLEKGILTILASKGGRDRLVYMSDDLTELCAEYYDYLCHELGGRPHWFFPGRNPDKPLVNTSVDRVFNRFWFRTPFSEICSNKPTVHSLRFTFVTNRINLWTVQGADIDVMMPYLQKYLGHKSLQDSYYYYHNSRQLYDLIRIKDKTADRMIPEVHDYE